MMMASTCTRLIDDLDKKEFLKLDKIIGCPDCTDGGAEWTKVRFSDGKKHKVPFEYQNEPDVLEDFIPELRLIMEGFTNC